MDYIISGAEAAGQTVEDFLRSHKSALGITEGNVKTYADRVTKYQGEKQTKTGTSGTPVPDPAAVADSEAHYAARQAAAGTGTAQTGTSSQSELQVDGRGNVVDPGPTSSFRKQFLYEFTQRANSGAQLQELYDQLDVAVENGWITAAEAESLRRNAQIVYATHFAK